MSFPKIRLRRLRKNEVLRSLVRETKISIDDLVMPIFVTHGRDVRNSVRSMPGIYQLSLDNLIKEVREIKSLGIAAIILFGIPKKKDELGSEAYAEKGIIQEAIKVIKDKFSDILLITDVCLCEYTSHGHCGIVKRLKDQDFDEPFDKLRAPSNVEVLSRVGSRAKEENYLVDNDATLELLAKTAVSQAKAGADIVAPSAMMDGQVKAIRQILDEEGFEDRLIMSYSAKYSSSFYGPFREAADSPPRFGDRKSYQLDFGNINQALREIELDIEEGADIIMVKPALAYLDVIRMAKEKFSLPLCAYNVSGEYSMIKAGGKLGWIDSDKVMLEVLTSIKRAGADFIITYFAKEAAKILNSKS